MSATSDDALRSSCERLRAAAETPSDWEWDGRFEAGLLEFEKAREPDVLAILDEVFDKIWSAGEMGTAPADVRALDQGLGGLRSGQMLLTAILVPGTTLWCAWWPWGSEPKVSIRVGVLAPASEDALERYLSIMRSVLDEQGA